MLANYFFKDLYADIDPGFLAQTLAASTASQVSSGSAIQLGGSFAIGKLLFKMVGAPGSIATSVSMYLATATVSSGTFLSISQTLTSLITTASLSEGFKLVIDTRNEAFANLGTGSAAPTWVKVVVSWIGAAVPTSMECLGWEVGTDPASLWNSTTLQIAYTAFY
jgi:hypothetical protein